MDTNTAEIDKTKLINAAMENIKKDQPSKKQVQEEKQREQRIVAELNKSLNNLTPEAKVTLLYNKCLEFAKENARYEVAAKVADKKYESSLKEREYLQLELNKGVLSRSKLESLCRELQKCNKSIKDESMAKIKEEEEKRRETQEKFQKSLNEITVMMNENNDKNKKLRDDNMELTQKFKHILEQYELREQQIERVSHQLDLGNQLNDAKMAKLQMEKSVEKETMLREKAELLAELERNKKQIVELSAKERILREQLNMYSEKYEDFQTSIKKSSSIFTGYKSEIDKMSKNMKKLEKDSTSWRTKFEKSNAHLLDLISEKQVRDQHITKTARQLFFLQKLCRTLQTERQVILQKLKENNIECPPIPEPPLEIEPEFMQTPTIPKFEDKTDRIELMAKNCSEMKQNLLQLQGQLSAMTEKPGTDGKETTTATPAVGTGNATAKKNKNKNKKNKGKAEKEVFSVVEEIVATAAEATATTNGDGVSEERNSTELPESEATVCEEIIKSNVNSTHPESVVNGIENVEEKLAELDVNAPVLVAENASAHVAEIPACGE